MNIYCLSNKLGESVISYSDAHIGITIKHCMELLSYRLDETIKRTWELSLDNANGEESDNLLDYKLKTRSIKGVRSYEHHNKHHRFIVEYYSYHLYIIELCHRLILEYEFRFKRIYKFKYKFYEYLHTEKEVYDLMYKVTLKGIGPNDEILLDKLSNHSATLSSYLRSKTAVKGFFDTTNHYKTIPCLNITKSRSIYRSRKNRLTFTNRPIPTWMTSDSSNIIIQDLQSKGIVVS